MSPSVTIVSVGRKPDTDPRFCNIRARARARSSSIWTKSMWNFLVLFSDGGPYARCEYSLFLAFVCYPRVIIGERRLSFTASKNPDRRVKWELKDASLHFGMPRCGSLEPRVKHEREGRSQKTWETISFPQSRRRTRDLGPNLLTPCIG
jgi:hypothetical protein